MDSYQLYNNHGFYIGRCLKYPYLNFNYLGVVDELRIDEIWSDEMWVDEIMSNRFVTGKLLRSIRKNLIFCTI